MNAQSIFDNFVPLKTDPPDLHWYAIADAAQSPDLPYALSKNREYASLLGAPEGTALASLSPYLVSMPPPLDSDASWQWVSKYGAERHAVMIIATEEPFLHVYEHLRSIVPVTLPDETSMALAFWDPAIFATLASIDDDSLYVKGPVLTIDQLAAVFSGLNAWWYWDRNGGVRRLAPPVLQSREKKLPLALNQCQVDMLIEASLPDHVRYFVELNQPLLLQDIPRSESYGFFTREIKKAKSYGLDTIADLVNYICFALITREAGPPPAWDRSILPRLKAGQINLDEALAELTEGG